jgi:hypothetical protein
MFGLLCQKSIVKIERFSLNILIDAERKSVEIIMLERVENDEAKCRAQ